MSWLLLKIGWIWLLIVVLVVFCGSWLLMLFLLVVSMGF